MTKLERTPNDGCRMTKLERMTNYERPKGMTRQKLRVSSLGRRSDSAIRRSDLLIHLSMISSTMPYCRACSAERTWRVSGGMGSHESGNFARLRQKAV